MMKYDACVIDYGIGNLHSVDSAIKECGGKALITSEPEEILKSNRVFLPGVGAFSNAMKLLHSLSLIDVLQEVASRGTPLLGVCLGMQLLMDESHEFGVHKGLGLIPGKVIPICPLGVHNNSLKIPHIGWSSLEPSFTQDWGGSILKNFSPFKDSVYFVHSYKVDLEDHSMELAHCIYGGQKINAVISNKNITGCQFHPEKSGLTGLKIIKNWLLQ